MTTKNIAGVELTVSTDGYLTDHSQWTEQIGAAIATEEGIDMNDAHWKVINILHDEMSAKNQLPTIRGLKKLGVPTKELYDLFPGGPLKKASKIAGYSKPASCV